MIRPIAFGNAFATAAAVFYTVCAFFAALMPTAIYTIGAALSRGLGMGAGELMGAMPWGLFFLGLVCLVVGSWAFGFVLATLYNRFAGEPAEVGSQPLRQSSKRAA